MSGQERIRAAFASRRPALITYVMGGDPNPKASVEMAMACVEGGADLLELGVPFSDPIADGRTIQAAGERALAAGTRVADVLAIARQVRRRSQVPILLMGYLNPFLAYGAARLVEDCVRSGVDGLIIPDLPPEESNGLATLARARELGTVFFLAPTSTESRRAVVLERSSGFVYFVSVTGVTGARTALPRELGAQLEAARAQSPVPIAVGFGVSTPAQVRRLGRNADAVVVGSAIVARIAKGGSARVRAERVRRFVKSLAGGRRG
jgi:tryptophan synthase alpha chain